MSVSDNNLSQPMRLSNPQEIQDTGYESSSSDVSGEFILSSPKKDIKKKSNNNNDINKNDKKFNLDKIKNKITKGIDNITAQTHDLMNSADDVLKKVSANTGIRFAPLLTPLKRRRQTFAVLVYLCMFFTCVFINFIALRYWTGMKFYLYILYITWKLTFQTFHKDGGLPIEWFRYNTFWKWFCDYFPIILHKTYDLDAGKTNYIFGYHPHGIIGMGAFGTFAAMNSGFSKLFPNVDVRLLTLRLNFYLPFFGFFLTCMGVCDVSRESCDNILNTTKIDGTKKSICIVLGGAKESLDAHPDQVKLFLNRRKGFVKLALCHGASLVPVFGFGENELFKQMKNPKGSLTRRIQEKLQTKLGFAIPLFHGRGIFQYNYGLMPIRTPINVVFGKPIKCPKLAKSQIDTEMIRYYHEEYKTQLKELFDQHKHKFYTNPPQLQFV